MSYEQTCDSHKMMAYVLVSWQSPHEICHLFYLVGAREDEEA